MRRSWQLRGRFATLLPLALLAVAVVATPPNAWAGRTKQRILVDEPADKGASSTDATPPTITITSPQHGILALSRAIPITVTYSDAQSGVDLTTFHLYLTNVDQTNLMSVKPNAAMGTATMSADGLLAIRAEIKDQAGNLGQATAAVTVLTDTASPTPILGPVNTRRLVVWQPLPQFGFLGASNLGDQILIQFKPGTSLGSIQAIFTQHDLIPIGAIPSLGLYQLTWKQQWNDTNNNGVRDPGELYTCTEPDYTEGGNICNSGEVAWTAVAGAGHPEVQLVTEHSLVVGERSGAEQLPVSLTSHYQFAQNTFFDPGLPSLPLVAEDGQVHASRFTPPPPAAAGNLYSHWHHFYLQTFAANRLVDLVASTSASRPVRLAIIDTGLGTGTSANGDPSVDIPFSRLADTTLLDPAAVYRASANLMGLPSTGPLFPSAPYLIHNPAEMYLLRDWDPGDFLGQWLPFAVVVGGVPTSDSFPLQPGMNLTFDGNPVTVSYTAATATQPSRLTLTGVLTTTPPLPSTLVAQCVSGPNNTSTCGPGPYVAMVPPNGQFSLSIDGGLPGTELLMHHEWPQGHGHMVSHFAVGEGQELLGTSRHALLRFINGFQRSRLTAPQWTQLQQLWPGHTVNVDVELMKLLIPLYLAAQDPDVAVISLSSGAWFNEPSGPDWELFNTVLNQLHANGKIFVGCAGNKSGPMFTELYPQALAPAGPRLPGTADDNLIVVVGGTTLSGTVAAGGQLDPAAWGAEAHAPVRTGPRVSIAAPFGPFIATTAAGVPVNIEGTSYSTPIAAGVAAEMVWLDKNHAIAPDRFTPMQIVELLEATADDLGAPGRDPEFGFGRVNAWKALLSVANGGVADAKGPDFPSLNGLVVGEVATQWYGFILRTPAPHATAWLCQGASCQQATDTQDQFLMQYFGGQITTYRASGNNDTFPSGQGMPQRYAALVSAKRADIIGKTLRVYAEGKSPANNDPALYILDLSATNLDAMRRNTIAGVTFDDFVFDIRSPYAVYTFSAMRNVGPPYGDETVDILKVDMATGASSAAATLPTPQGGLGSPSLEDLQVLPDGRLVIVDSGGDPNHLGPCPGTFEPGPVYPGALYVVNPKTGTVDQTFSTCTPFLGSPGRVLVDSDGTLLVYGWLVNFQGTGTIRISRVNLATNTATLIYNGQNKAWDDPAFLDNWGNGLALLPPPAGRTTAKYLVLPSLDLIAYVGPPPSNSWVAVPQLVKMDLDTGTWTPLYLTPQNATCKDAAWLQAVTGIAVHPDGTTLDLLENPCPPDAPRLRRFAGGALQPLCDAAAVIGNPAISPVNVDLDLAPDETTLLFVDRPTNGFYGLVCDPSSGLSKGALIGTLPSLGDGAIAADPGSYPTR